jgi:hypothetical protein
MPFWGTRRNVGILRDLTPALAAKAGIGGLAKDNIFDSESRPQHSSLGRGRGPRPQVTRPEEEVWAVRGRSVVGARLV